MLLINILVLLVCGVYFCFIVFLSICVINSIKCMKLDLKEVVMLIKILILIVFCCGERER